MRNTNGNWKANILPFSTKLCIYLYGNILLISTILCTCLYGTRIQILNFTKALVMTRKFHALHWVNPRELPFKNVWPGIFWNDWAAFTMETSRFHSFQEDHFVSMCLQANRSSFTITLDAQGDLKGPGTIWNKTRLIETLLAVMSSAVFLSKHFRTLKYYIKSLMKMKYPF